MRTTIAAVALIGSFAAAACGHAGAGARSPHVPAGSGFEAALESPIAMSSAPGAPVAARVQTEVRDARGDLVIAPGDRLVGRVVAVDAGPAPSIRVLWSAIESPSGRFPVDATLRGSARSGACYEALEIDSTALGYSAVLVPPSIPAYGGGPVGAVASCRGDDVRLPAGTRLHLLLTRPVAAMRPEP